MPFVNEYVMPLNQQLGAQCKPVVEPGERVVRGQLIAEPGLYLHQSAQPGDRLGAGNRQPSLSGWCVREIDRDRSRPVRQPAAAERRRDWRHLTPEQFVAEIQLAGIVGMGGAAFPAHAKYSIPGRTAD